MICHENKKAFSAFTESFFPFIIQLVVCFYFIALSQLNLYGQGLDTLFIRPKIRSTLFFNHEALLHYVPVASTTPNDKNNDNFALKKASDGNIYFIAFENDKTCTPLFISFAGEYFSGHICADSSKSAIDGVYKWEGLNRKRLYENKKTKTEISEVDKAKILLFETYTNKIKDLDGTTDTIVEKLDVYDSSLVNFNQQLHQIKSNLKEENPLFDKKEEHSKLLKFTNEDLSAEEQKLIEPKFQKFMNYYGSLDDNAHYDRNTGLTITKGEYSLTDNSGDYIYLYFELKNVNRKNAIQLGDCSFSILDEKKNKLTDHPIKIVKDSFFKYNPKHRDFYYDISREVENKKYGFFYFKFMLKKFTIQNNHILELSINEKNSSNKLSYYILGKYIRDPKLLD